MKDDNNWNYSGPLRGKLFPLKEELKIIWPHSKEFLITFKSGLSLNEITLQADQHEPEPEKQSEVLSNGVPRDLYHADGTPNYGKAARYIESLRLNLPR